MSVRKEQLSENVTLYCGDCREITSLPSDAAIVSDPPYGMGWNTNSKRFSGGQNSNRVKQRGPGRNDWPEIAGDAVAFDPTHWLAYPEVILWGANHFAAALPTGTSLVWVKKDPHLWGTWLSDAEIGWMKGGHGVYVRAESFPPVTRIREHDGQQAAHPTQKPIGLMEWCLQRVDAQTIIDPFMGSGTTGIACIRQRRVFYGVEVELRYFDTACRRISDELRRPRLFAEPVAKPVQEGLFV